jgi:hypothetical protein
MIINQKPLHGAMDAAVERLNNLKEAVHWQENGSSFNQVNHTLEIMALYQLLIAVAVSVEELQNAHNREYGEIG